MISDEYKIHECYFRFRNRNFRNLLFALFTYIVHRIRYVTNISLALARSFRVRTAGGARRIESEAPKVVATREQRTRDGKCIPVSGG